MEFSIIFYIWILSNNLFIEKQKAKSSFYTLNTLSVSLGKSPQIRHLYRKLHNSKRRNSTRKNRIQIHFLTKDQIYTKDCTK